MFAALFLLIIGVVMVVGAIRGLRRGRVMSLILSAERSDDRYVYRGEARFWFFAICWLGGGAVILYYGVRLMFSH